MVRGVEEYRPFSCAYTEGINLAPFAALSDGVDFNKWIMVFYIFDIFGELGIIILSYRKNGDRLLCIKPYSLGRHNMMTLVNYIAVGKFIKRIKL